MSANIYHLLHVGGVILLAAFTFQAFGSAERSKGGMILGILSLVFLVAGFALVNKLGLEFNAGWLLVKMGCGVGLAAIAAMAPKRPALRVPLSLGAIALILTAVYMVYFRPF
jgi:prepilin signal peptidase PulO-like enzyme (type II secretory pathway)